MVTLYHVPDGSPIKVWPVDVGELLAGGEYVIDEPSEMNVVESLDEQTLTPDAPSGRRART